MAELEKTQESKGGESSHGKKGQKGAEKPGLTNPLLPPPPLISDQDSFMKTIKDHVRPVMGVAYKEKEFSLGGSTYKDDPDRTMMTKD